MKDLIAKNEIVVYQPDEVTRLDVRLENESVWLSQEQMIELFKRDRSVISRHINNAFKEGEVGAANCLHILQTNQKGQPTLKTKQLNGSPRVRGRIDGGSMI